MTDKPAPDESEKIEQIEQLRKVSPIFVCKQCQQTEMPKKEQSDEEKTPKKINIKITACKNKQYMYCVKIGQIYIDEIGHTGNNYKNKEFDDLIFTTENMFKRQLWKLNLLKTENIKEKIIELQEKVKEFNYVIVYNEQKLEKTQQRSDKLFMRFQKQKAKQENAEKKLQQKKKVAEEQK